MYTGFTIAVCLCPSVCPSVKKWFLYNNSSSIWHTMMILHLYVDLDLRRISVDFGSKGQRSNLDFKLFYRFRTTASFAFGIRNDTSQMYWPRPEKDLYWLWGQRIKGQCHIWSLTFVSFPHDKSIYFLAYNNDTSQMYWPWPEKDLSRFGVNRLKIKVKFGLLTFYNLFYRFCLITPFPFGIQWWYFTHVLSVTPGGPLSTLRSKVNFIFWI